MRRQTRRTKENIGEVIFPTEDNGMTMWKRWAISVTYYALELACVICCAGDRPWLGPVVALIALIVGLGTTFFIAWRGAEWVMNPYWDTK